MRNAIPKKFTPLESRHYKIVVTNKKINGEGDGQSCYRSAFLTGFIFYGIIAVLFLPLVSPLLLAPIGIVLFPDSFAKAIVFRIVVEILLIIFLFSALLERRRHNCENNHKDSALIAVKPKLLFWLFATLWFVMGLSTLFSSEPHQSIWDLQYRSLGFFFYSHLFVFLFILIYFLRDQKLWDRIFTIMIGMAGMVSLLGILQWFGVYLKMDYIEITSLERPGSTLGNPNSFGAYLVIMLPITFLYLWKSWRLWRLGNPISGTKLTELFPRFIPCNGILRIVFFSIIFTLEIISLIAAGSRAAILGFLASTILFLILYPFSRPFIKKIILSVLMVFIIFSIVSIRLDFLNDISTFNRFSGLLSSSSTGLTRLTAWQSGLKSFADRPILGFGPENFAIAFDRNYNPFFGKFGGLEEHWWGRAHNFIIEWLTGMGIIGFAIYALIYGYIFSVLYKIRYNRHPYGNRRKISTERDSMAISPSWDDKLKQIVATVLISIFGGYLTFNLFNFDVPVTLTVIFIMLGYTYFIINISLRENRASKTPPVSQEKQSPIDNNAYAFYLTFPPILLGMLFLLWNYNLKPFFINIKANKIETEFETRPEKSFNNYLKILEKSSYIDHDLNLRFYVLANKYTNYFIQQENTQKILEIRKIVIKKLEKNLTLKPYFTRNYLFLGDSYTYLVTLDPENEQENFNRANDHYLKSIKLSPRRQEGYLGLAQLLRSVGQYDESIKILKNVVELNDQYGPAHFWLAINYFYKDELDNGKKELKKALTSDYQLPLNNLKIVFEDRPEVLQKIMDEVK